MNQPRYCVNAASLAFKAGDGGQGQGAPRGFAAGLAHSLSKLLPRRRNNVNKGEEEKREGEREEEREGREGGEGEEEKPTVTSPPPTNAA